MLNTVLLLFQHLNTCCKYRQIESEKTPVYKISKRRSQSAGHEPQTRLELEYLKEPPQEDQNTKDVY